MSTQDQVRHFAENAYMVVLRDIIQPVLVVAITGIGGWFMVDHIRLRTDVSVVNSELLAMNRDLIRHETRLHSLEELTLANASNRFTDQDADVMEKRLQRNIAQIEKRMDRMEARIAEIRDRQEAK